MTRIPTRTAHEAMQEAMQTNFARLTDAQRQLATGKRINKVSDAPTDAINATRMRNEEKLTNAYVTSANDATSMLSAQDSALQNASTIIIRIRELAVAGSSEIESDNGQQAIALELLEGLRDQLVSLANTTYDGRAVFGGFSASAVQNVGGSVSWVGDSNSVDRRVSSELTVSASTDGSKVFGFNAGSPAGSDNLFAVINRTIGAVRNGDAAGVRAELDNISARQADVTSALGSVGGRVNQIEMARSEAQDKIASLQSSRSLLEDVDMGSATVDLKDAEAAYEATLAIVARMQQVSLLDFLR